MLKFKVIADDKALAAIKKKVARASTTAEKTVAAQVLKDCDYYLPMRTGSLRERSHIEDGPDGPLVVYPGPYARFLYYGKLMVDPDTGSPFAPKYGHKIIAGKDIKIWQSTNPHATSHWFEVAKAMNLEQWEDTAADAISKKLKKDNGK